MIVIDAHQQKKNNEFTESWYMYHLVHVSQILIALLSWNSTNSYIHARGANDITSLRAKPIVDRLKFSINFVGNERLFRMCMASENILSSLIPNSVR